MTLTETVPYRLEVNEPVTHYTVLTRFCDPTRSTGFYTRDKEEALALYIAAVNEGLTEGSNVHEVEMNIRYMETHLSLGSGQMGCTCD